MASKTRVQRVLTLAMHRSCPGDNPQQPSLNSLSSPSADAKRSFSIPLEDETNAATWRAGAHTFDRDKRRCHDTLQEQYTDRFARPRTAFQLTNHSSILIRYWNDGSVAQSARQSDASTRRSPGTSPSSVVADAMREIARHVAECSIASSPRRRRDAWAGSSTGFTDAARSAGATNLRNPALLPAM
jgi:hypothetical protein